MKIYESIFLAEFGDNIRQMVKERGRAEVYETL